MTYSINTFDKKIDFIEVKNNLNLKFELSNFGAGLYSLFFDDEPLILVNETKEDFLYATGYYGKALGVVAGRIPNKGEIEGKPYNLLAKEGNDFTLHGGEQKSLSYRPWKYHIKENKNNTVVTFYIRKKDLDNGFPGEFIFRVIYEISNNSNEFKMIFKTRCIKDGISSLSTHIYWCFGKEQDLNNYSLKVNSSRCLKMQPNLLPIEEMDIPNYLDFRRTHLLKSSLTYIEDNLDIGTIDNTFLFDEKIGKTTLKNKKYVLKLSTSFPAMNIYCDSSLKNYKFINYENIVPRRAIALEPQLNVVNFNSLISHKGDVKTDYIKFKISKI